MYILLATFAYPYFTVVNIFADIFEGIHSKIYFVFVFRRNNLFLVRDIDYTPLGKENDVTKDPLSWSIIFKNVLQTKQINLSQAPQQTQLISQPLLVFEGYINELVHWYVGSQTLLNQLAI
ncbi:hypothetical protein ABPG74_022041 [Tetrahymena malaccensis]